MTMYPPEMTPQPSVQPPAKSAWPTAIGIISIVLGALCDVCSPINIGIQLSGGFLTHNARDMHSNMPQWYLNYGIANNAMHMVTYTLVLIGGILLLRRRPVGRTLHIVFAAVQLTGTLVSIVVISAFFHAITEPLPPQLRGVMVPSFVCSFIFATVYPVFLLIWFFRPSIRQEVELWRGGPQPQ